jgi:hypothetical protein
MTIRKMCADRHAEADLLRARRHGILDEAVDSHDRQQATRRRRNRRRLAGRLFVRVGGFWMRAVFFFAFFALCFSANE